MTFDYKSIPVGYYDKIINQANSIRSFWHWHKFSSVRRALGKNKNKKILDIGCFAGSFLRMLDEDSYSCQIGVDILPTQIDYANENYGNKNRTFLSAKTFDDFEDLIGKQLFDYITVIEVIEHLTAPEIIKLLQNIHHFLKPKGTCVITTPNYISLWPLLEWYINTRSDICYDEQHVTKFNYFNFFNKLERIYPKLSDQFIFNLRTTTHFFTPYLSIINYKCAKKIALKVAPKQWMFPFGSLIMVTISKK